MFCFLSFRGWRSEAHAAGKKFAVLPTEGTSRPVYSQCPGPAAPGFQAGPLTPQKRQEKRQRGEANPQPGCGNQLLCLPWVEARWFSKARPEGGWTEKDGGQELTGRKRGWGPASPRPGRLFFKRARERRGPQPLQAVVLMKNLGLMRC